MPRPSSPPPAPPPNTPLGSYTLVDRIAVGGMAEVFRALEPRAAGEPRVVVLKRMLPHIADESNAHQMFAEEARLASHVVHPNVVHVLGHGEIEGKPYLTLEYVPGCDLWRLNRRLTLESKRLEHDLVVYIVRQMLSGLDAVHNAKDRRGSALGIVHRDISPSNVLISIHGDVKIADFGIARSGLNPFDADTAARANGKLGYLAPEQVSGGVVDPRADLFSTAVIAAELFMRRPLFAGGSELAVLLAIRDAEVHPFLEFLPQLPEGLGAVILSALSARPEDRPPTARAFWAALEPWQSRPEEVLRSELSRIVAEIANESRTRRTSADVLPRQTMPPTPMVLADEHPSTTNVTPLEYKIRKPNGATVGPLAYAKVVEAVATGQVDGHDHISIAGGDFQPLSAIKDLYRHVPPSRMTPTTTRVESATAADRCVEFENGGFVDALARTVITRRTGLWLCEQGGVRKEVYAKQGVPAFVTSNLAGELLGEYLVKERIINRSELDMALAVMPRFEGKLGDTLVALGLVEPLELFQHIAEQVREKLLDLFTWSTGTATFYEGVDPPSSGFPLRLDAWEILDRGIQRRIAAGLESKLILERGGDKVVQADRIDTAVATAALPDDVRAALRLCKTPHSIEELAQFVTELPSTHDPQRGYRVAALLLSLGAVHWT
ncbi:MAG: serine/threonine-protein kinase [Myxococcales bacterium]